jgi:1-acyl-sn-glycerol-3-phosphate acyltransferase
VSNHPSTLMDPLMVAGYKMNPHVNFLANASLFKNRFGNWFFTTFYCIKIERPQDTNGRPINNAEAFKMAIDHVAQKGSLYIAVEGSSYMERRLRDVKTGAARIALFAEAANDFQLGTNILPVGLDYDAPHRFRSRVAINVGEPIMVADFKTLYLSDPNAAVVALTDAMENALKSLIIHVEDAEQELLLRQIETIQQHDNQVSPIENVDRLKAFLIKIKNLKETQNTDYQDIVAKFKDYFNTLKTKNIRDNVISKPVFFLLKILFLILAFPIFVIGIVNHILVLIVVYLLHKKLKDLYIGYYTSMYFLVGLLILLPILYPLQNAVISAYSDIHISTWLYIPIAVICGVVAWYWFVFAKDMWGRLSLSSSKYTDLKAQRIVLCSILDKLTNV